MMTYYVLTCTDDHGWHDYDAIWGTERRVFASKEEAEIACRHLEDSGDWGDAEPPEYDVEECGVADILADEDLRHDLLTLLKGDPWADALAEADETSRQLQRELKTQLLRANALALNSERVMRAIAQMHGAPSANGGVNVADARCINELPSAIANLASMVLEPLIDLADRLDDAMRGMMQSGRHPCVLQITPDLKHVLVYHVTHQREPLDGWWRVEDLRRRIGGDLSATPMTPEQCKAVGVWR